MHILKHWLLSGLAIIIASYLLPGVHVSTFVTALVLAVVLAVINLFLKPLLLLLTLPLTIITFGFFALIVNTALIMLADVIVPGFAVEGFWWAFLFGLVLMLVQGVLSRESDTL